VTLPVRVREMRPADEAFVLDTWRRSFSDESDLYKLDADAYARWMRQLIGRRIHERGALVRVACDPEDDDTLVGWAATTGPELHYVYVRGGKDTSMRGLGVVPALLDGLAIATYTFRTQAGERRIKPRARGWTFAPRFQG
jgi:hypothetical protein